MSFLCARCRSLENKKKLVRHTSGNNEEYTIFDALFESMIKQKEKKSSVHRFLDAICSPWNLIILRVSSLGAWYSSLGKRKKTVRYTSINEEEFVILDSLLEGMIDQKEKKSSVHRFLDAFHSP